MITVMVCLLLVILIGLETANLLQYRRMIKNIRDLDAVRKDWGILADGHSGNAAFERLWLRVAQQEFIRIAKESE